LLDVEILENNKYVNIFNTLYENKNILLTPNSKPFFIFNNSVLGESDPGIDAGGLTKTVFYELSKYLIDENSPFFVKDEITGLYSLKMYTGNDKETHYSKLYFLGQLFGLALKFEQMIEINLDPILLYQLTHTLSSDKVTKEIVEKIINELDSSLLKTLPYMCYNNVMAQTNYVCIYNEDGEIIDESELEKETNHKISYFIKGQKDYNRFFIKGFRSQINIKESKIDKLPLNKLNELIAGITNTDLQTFNSHINYINFTSEQKNILKQIIDEHIKKNGEKKYLEMLLMVMSGFPKISPTGYKQSNVLRFELNENIEPKPIDIHSCFNQFIINPKLFDEYLNASNKEQSELYKIFSLDTLKKLSLDFSSA
jgi:hypothetical protein